MVSPHFFVSFFLPLLLQMYSHVNNVHYLALFDTAINTFLIKKGLLDPKQKCRASSSQPPSPIGFCVESKCTYYSPVSFPEVLRVGVCVGHIGSSSVKWEVGVFNEGASNVAAASGHFVHVFVNPETNAKTPVPENVRKVLETVKARTTS